MLLRPGRLEDLDGDAFSYEVKWDGFRALFQVDRGQWRMRSRHGTDLTDRAPELAGLARRLRRRRVLLDGELVVLGPDGCADFRTLRRRVFGDASDRTPLSYIAFDVLWLDGIDLTHLTYDERREVLESLDLDGPEARTSQRYDADPADLVATTRERRVEGLVAKRRTSRYFPGERANAWLKIKNRDTETFRIGAWAETAGGIEALYVGRVCDRGQLSYAGRVDLGFSATSPELRDALSAARADRSAFAGWAPRRLQHARPTVEVDIAFTRSGEGELREAVLQSVRR